MPAPRKGAKTEKADAAVAAADSGEHAARPHSAPGVGGLSPSMTAPAGSIAQSSEGAASNSAAQLPLGMATKIWESSGRWPLAATAGSDATMFACSEPVSPATCGDQEDLWSAQVKKGRLARCESSEAEPTLAGLLARSVIGSGLKQVEASPISRAASGSGMMRSVQRSPDYSPIPSSQGSIQAPWQPNLSRNASYQGEPTLSRNVSYQGEPPERVHPGDHILSPELSVQPTPSLTPEILRLRTLSEGFGRPPSGLSMGAKSPEMKLSTPNGTIWQGKEAKDSSKESDSSVRQRQAEALEVLDAGATSLQTAFEDAGAAGEVLAIDPESTWSLQVLRMLHLEAQHSPSSAEPRPGIRNISTAAIARAFGLPEGLGATKARQASRASLYSAGSGITSKDSVYSSLAASNAFASSNGFGKEQRGISPPDEPRVPKLNFDNVHMGDDGEEDEEDFANKVGYEADGVAKWLPQSDPEQQKEKLAAFGVPALALNSLPAEEEVEGARDGELSDALKTQPQMRASASAVELRNVHREEDSSGQGGLPAVPSANSLWHRKGKSRHALSMYIDDQCLMLLNSGKRKFSKQQRKSKERPNGGSKSAFQLPPLQENQRFEPQLQRSASDKAKGMSGASAVHAHIHHHIHLHRPPGFLQQDIAPVLDQSPAIEAS